MSKLWQARFFTTVNQLRELPDTKVPEIAFAGRSNAGKSTAINILCNQKGLAFASKTPGRTQHINYFSIGGAMWRSTVKTPPSWTRSSACWSTCPATAMPKCPVRQIALAAPARRLCPAPRTIGRLILIMDSRRPFTGT
jgi:GTP-binding protein